MKFTIKKHLFILACFTCLITSNAYAGKEQIINSLSGSSIVPSVSTSLIVEDQKRLFMISNPNWACRFGIKKSNVSVVLRFDDTKRNFDNTDWVLNITYDITLYKASITPYATLTAENATITYKKSAGQNYSDVFLKTYEGALKAELKITSVSWTPAGGASFPSIDAKYNNDIFIDLLQETDRFYNLTFNGFNCTAIALPAPVVTTSVSPLSLNQSLLVSCNNQLPIAWNYIEGAESYDVEWLFVDAARPTPLNSLFDLDFANATRVNLSQQHYEIPMAYPRGILVYRVRGVGLDHTQTFTKRTEGEWSVIGNNVSNLTALSGNSYIKYYDGLDTLYNWQYSAAFAEDGKRKEVISYFDGSLRNRQSTTILNSDNTAVVAETKYDFQGRPTVQMLPTPMVNTGIHFTTNFNPAFNKDEFDIDSRYATGGTAPVPSTDGTGNYYSNNSSSIGIDAYTPDAQGMPYTQTRYKADGTGRIVAQSGVGSKHMLGVKDTRYYYGTPAGQAELDRLFGNEVGNILHYKKNMVVDANGQVSITYLDQEGRTIATALSGNAPENLLEIDGKPAPTPMITDILTGKNLISDDARIAKTTILTTQPSSNYTFNYSLNIDTACYGYHLNPTDPICKLCEDCVFDLEIKITDEDGKNIAATIAGGASYNAGAITCPTYPSGGVNSLLKCSSIETANYSINVIFPNIGSYQIEKIIRVSHIGIENATTTFTNTVLNPPCGPFTKPLTAAPCNDCDYLCNKEYGVFADNNYITQATITPTVTTDKYGHLLTTLTTVEADKARDDYAQCVGKCNNPFNIPDECTLKATVLFNDMSPGGQYFDNLRDQTNTCSPALSPTGINTWLDNNILNTAVAGGATGDPFWSNLYTYACTAPNNCLPVGSNFPVANRNWDSIRANWNDCFAKYFIKYHPEYCNYKFYCGDVETCYSQETIKTFTTNSTGLSTVVLNTITMKHSNLYDKVMNNDVARLFFNPLSGVSGAIPALYKSDLDVTSPIIITTALAANTSEYYDPLFSNRCAPNLKIYCTTGSPTDILTAMSNYLNNFHIANPATTPIPMSIWYVLDDPDGIAGKAYGYTFTSAVYLPSGTVLDNATIDLFNSFHSSTGILATSGATKYQLFKTMYNGYKKFILYGLFSTSFDCPNNTITVTSAHASTALDSDPLEAGFTSCTSPPLNSIPRAQIRFPKNDIFDMMVATCPDFKPSIGAMSSFTAASLASTCQSNCEGFSDSWMYEINSKLAACSLSVPVPSAVLASIKADLISVCLTGCDGANPQGLSYVPSGYTGPPAPPSSGLTFNAVINTYLSSYVSGCASFFPNVNIVHPPAPFSQASCSCEALKTFAIDNGIIWDLANSGLNVLIATKLNSELDLDFIVTNADVTNWLNTCFVSGPPASITSLTATPVGINSYPDAFICPSSDEPFDDDPCGDAQAIADAAYESARIEAIAVASSKAIFLKNYTLRCLQKLDFNEHLNAVYSLDEYYYTLYYYDQAANLIKTVPPEGVHPLPVLTTAGVFPDINTQNAAEYRLNPLASGVQYTWPYHTMVTNYKYNTLNQLREQLTPDGGVSKFYYDKVGRLVVSQNAKQAAYTGDKGYSYTLYDNLSRIIEVGEMTSSTAMTQDIAKDEVALTAFLGVAYTSKHQITRTYYDEAPFDATIGAIGGDAIESLKTRGIYASGMFGYLRNRVSCVTFIENDFNHTIPPGSRKYYDNATHYSYDIHGNVKTLFVENTELAQFNYDVNRVDYNYDLISGKVNEVHFNDGKADQFHHQYYYDADNRLTAAYTSRNGKLWEKEAKYFYYKHGPLARTELGDKQVQATDYAYTIQGWIKGINSTTLDNSNDIGKDGYTVGTNLNSVFANDAASYSLGYFNGDYIGKNPAIASSFVADNTGIYAGTLSGSSPCAELFNGNIANMATNIYLPVSGVFVKSPQIKGYRYDQLNRIKRAKSHESMTGNVWANETNFANKYHEEFTYDFNGNINALKRYDDASVVMDDLNYNYTPNLAITPPPSPGISYKPDNKLRFVVENAGVTAIATDIENQLIGNYDYDNIGNLIKDESEKIANIAWTVYGKIKTITRTAGVTPKSDLEYIYDAQGNRIEKIEKTRDALAPFALKSSIDWKRTYYIRDAQGNVMATYNHQINYSVADGGVELQLAERHIYGSSRLGILNDINLRLDVNAEMNHQSFFETGVYNGWVGMTGSAVSIDTEERLKVSVNASTPNVGTDLPLTTLIAGKTYQVTYDIDKSYIGDNSLTAVVLDGATEVYREIPLQGTNSFKFTALSTSPHIKFQNETTTNPAYDFYLDNIKIKEVTTDRVLGNKSYELTNHLGNVLTVVSDRKLAHTTTPTSDIIDYYTSEILSSSDGYVFHQTMPNRSYNSNSYRYGLSNGQEKDNEIFEGAFTAEYWEYDSRTGRRWNVDPITYPWQSSYACFNNNSIIFADPDGLEGKDWVKNVLTGVTEWDADVHSRSEYSKKYGDDKNYAYQGKITKGVDGNGSVFNGVSSGEKHYLIGQKAITNFDGSYSAPIEKNSPANATKEEIEQAGKVARENQKQSAYYEWASRSSGRIDQSISPFDFWSPANFLRGGAVKAGNRAFWSGAGSEAKALEQGFQTLGTTDAGKNLIKLTADMPYYPGSQAYNMWARLSTKYAQGARGTVNVFQNAHQGVGMESIWRLYEYPALLKNPNVTKINFINN